MSAMARLRILIEGARRGKYFSRMKDDHVELFVLQPRRALRYDVHPDLAQRVEQPVTAGFERVDELAVAEVQTDFVGVDLNSLEHDGRTSFLT
jgi:hypothetical protein